MLIQAGAGPTVAAHLGAALAASSSDRAADLLTVLLAPSFEARLAMLDTTDTVARLRLALGLVKVRSVAREDEVCRS